jgi:hypothetical protein
MQHLYTLLVWLLSLAPAMQASLVWMTASGPVSNDAKVASKPGSSDTRSIRVSLEPGSHEPAPAEPGREDTSQGASCGEPITPVVSVVRGAPAPLDRGQMAETWTRYT